MKRTFYLLVLMLMVGWPLSRANAQLSVVDKDFIIKECKIAQADIPVIPRLSDDTQAILQARIHKRNCLLLEPFETSRNYYRQLLQLGPHEPLPAPPAVWNSMYLTADEFENYMKIVENTDR
jgi:hypothetical protein